jgi:hypothetical protein
MRVLPLDAAVAFRAGDAQVVYSVYKSEPGVWQIREVFAGRTGGAFRSLAVLGPGDLPGTFAEHWITHGGRKLLERRGELLQAPRVTYALTAPPREIIVAEPGRPLTWQPGATAFRAGDRWFVYLLETDAADVPGRAILSLDGGRFHDLVGESFTGTGSYHTWRFVEPFHGSSGRVVRRGDELFVDDTAFASAPLPSELARARSAGATARGSVRDARRRPSLRERHRRARARVRVGTPVDRTRR